MPLIHAASLESWANLNAARDTLGELLRKLIYSNLGLENIRISRFLAHENNQLSGWDGTLSCQSEIPWIPSGTSVWELGTGNNARQKIRNDFAQRLAKELPNGWKRASTTYVAVTLRKIDDIVALVNELQENSPWAAVMIVDAQSFEEWIENTPNVETWLQEQGIGPAPTIHTLKKVWENWSQTTNPPVTENLVLAGREQATTDFKNTIVNSEGGPIHVKADSPEEAIAFIYSAIQAAENELFKDHQLARSIVINRIEDAGRFKQQSEPQNIILRPPATSESLPLARFGHTVISAFGNSSQVRRIDFKLNRADRAEFAKALTKMGMSPEMAEVEARACGSSPSIWRVWNLLNEGDPGDNVPNWATQENAHLVVPAILLGGWSDKSAGDKEVVALIANRTFEDYRDQLLPFINSDNPLLVKVGDASVVSAPATAFALMVGLINQGYLESFSEVVQRVFQEIDPSIDVQPDERPFMGIHGATLQHSSWLRNGLAESLLRIAVLGQRLEDTGVIPGGRTCQTFVDTLIKALPGLSLDIRLMESIRDQLPVLMEAAPVPFIEALESLLQGLPEKIQPIFEEGDGIFGHAYHTNLLWGLETLAWEPEYLGRVSMILARLAKIDPGGKLSNRPLNSLCEIFLAWHPGTNANLEERLQVLDLILDQESDIGWELLCTLMPKSHQTSSPTNEPTWKDFGRNKKKILTNKDVWDTYQQYITRAIIFAGQRPERWNAIIEFYDDVAAEHQDAIEDGLKCLAGSGISFEEKNRLWETLRGFINRHKEFPDASWSLPTEKIERLEKVFELFAPENSLDKAVWLFNDYFPDIPFPRDDLDKAQKELDRLRFEAISELWEPGNLETLRQFLNKSSYPDLIAPYLIKLLPEVPAVIEIVKAMVEGTDNEQFFANSLSGLAFEKFGNRWTKAILGEAKKSSWSPKFVVNVLMNYPDSLETFELIKSLGPDIHDEYWLRRRGWVNRENNATLAVAIEEFAKHGRALEAIRVAAKKWGVKPPQEYLNILDSALAEMNSTNRSNISNNLGYWVEQLFDWLREQPQVDKTELARREYVYLPLLTSSRKKKDLTLHKILGTDPTFFIEVICDLFKPSRGYPDGYEPPENSKFRAQLAFEMLNSWKCPPGINDNGQVEIDKLREWIVTVRSLAEKHDRVDIVDQYIGKIFFYFPEDPYDGLWPHQAMRQLLEELENKEIETGIEIEQFNSRGVVSKSLFDGGKQEHALAQQWHEKAQQIGHRWPRTRAILDRIAESWEAHAKWEDVNAEKDRLKYT